MHIIVFSFTLNVDENTDDLSLRVEILADSKMSIRRTKLTSQFTPNCKQVNVSIDICSYC